MASEGDSLEARVSAECPAPTREILTTAWNHDLAALKKLLDEPGKASFQDPKTGEAPLHAAIRSCGPYEPADAEGGSPSSLEAAKEVLRELFLFGAIWNDVDDHNETPGCVAERLGQKELYNLCVEAGVRAELLFALLDGYEALDSGDDEAEEDGEDAMELEVEHGNGALENGDEAPELIQVEEEPKFVPPKSDTDVEVKSEEYLRSKLTYSEGKLVDDEGNGVMMAWETDIMRRSVDALLPDRPAGKRILNIGFGMGIVDTMFAETKPAKHHIIEAHAEVLEHIAASESKFGASWEESGLESGAHKVHKGKWQDVCPKLLEEGQIYDAIYFDTFGEDYSQLRMFFTEYIPGLLDQDGTFGFFNGLGADRKICYDVYTKVVEVHLADAGLDVDWTVIPVDMSHLTESGKGEWEGVKRRYWTLNEYRLPTCTFLG